MQLDEILDKISLVDIIPAEYNPRKINTIEYSKLTDSINNFGLVDPIIINLKNNKIVGGHQRYKVLLDEHSNNPDDFKELYILKLGDIGWVFPSTDLKIESEEHEKALNILLNQTNLMGEWDNEKLETVLKDLDEINFDLQLTGFDDYEIELYLDDSLENFNYDIFNQSDDDDEDDDSDELPDDYVDVQGDNANKSFVVSIGFDNHDIANKFLDYLGYHRHMNRDTLQFMWTELDYDLDELLLEKYGEDYFIERTEDIE